MDSADDTRSVSVTASNLNRGTTSAIRESLALSRGFRPLLVNMIRKLISPDKGKKLQNSTSPERRLALCAATRATRRPMFGARL